MVPFNKQQRLSGWEVVSHCGLGLHFHNALVVQIFLWAPWASMQEEGPIQPLYPVLNSVALIVL